MTLKEVSYLHSQDQVVWTDPDGHEEKVLTILTIFIKGEVVQISAHDQHDNYCELECYAEELS